MKLASFRMIFSKDISMCVMCRKNKIKLTSECVFSLYGILLNCLKTYYCKCTYSWQAEWQQIFLHCHPVLRQVLEQLPHPLPGANSLVRRFLTEILTNNNLGRRDVYNFGWGHKWMMTKIEDLKVCQNLVICKNSVQCIATSNSHCSRIPRYPSFICQDFFHFSSFIHNGDNLNM